MRRLRDSCYPLTGSIVPLLFLWHTEYSTSSHSLRSPYPCAPVHMSHSASPSKDAGHLLQSPFLTPLVSLVNVQAKCLRWVVSGDHSFRIEVGLPSVTPPWSHCRT